jgi:phage tail-like protein
MSVAAILPSNATAFERAVAAGLTDTLPVPIRDILDPAVTPEAFLPFLAAHDSVDLWFSDWSVGRKRAMVEEAVTLARLKGTRAGVIRFLSYVDGTLVDAISYPERFILGRAIIGRTPINHPAFVARYLVKVETFKKPRAFILARSILGRHILKTPDRTKLRRALAAIRVAKALESEVRVDFAHKRQTTLDDGMPLDPGSLLGAWRARSQL